MIIVKNNTIETIKNWEDNTLYVLTDFDRTITMGNSDSSWSILSKSNMVPKEYVEERQKLYNKYRPIEIDETIDYEIKNKYMTEWWNKHIALFIKYKLSEEVINKAAKNLRIMDFREGAKDFLKNMRDRNIPVIIISAGIGNFIEQFLIKNDCNYDNIFIISNFIKFENGIASGVSNNVIHALNKNEVSLPDKIKNLIKDRNNVILLGDSISDIKMLGNSSKEKSLKIGFLDEKIEENKDFYVEQFDVVCINNVGYTDLSKKILILNK